MILNINSDDRIKIVEVDTNNQKAQLETSRSVNHQENNFKLEQGGFKPIYHSQLL